MIPRRASMPGTLCCLSTLVEELLLSFRAPYRPPSHRLSPSWGWGNPAEMVADGFQVVSTLGLYLSSNEDLTDWEDYYGSVHPLSSTTTNTSAAGYFDITKPEEVQRVLGGEACMRGAA